jgi:hypothetical protein
MIQATSKKMTDKQNMKIKTRSIISTNCKRPSIDIRRPNHKQSPTYSYYLTSEQSPTEL